MEAVAGSVPQMTPGDWGGRGKQRLRWARVGPGTRADLRGSRTLLPTPKCWVWQGGIQEGGEFQLPSSRAGDSLVRDAWVGELEC